MSRSIILSLALISAPSLIAQTVHTTADMQQREAKLLATAKAAPTGLGTDIMDDYGSDRTLLVVRVHSGDAERHQLWADEMVIQKGAITLVTGGTMQGEHPNGTAAPGETLGTSIQGGKETVLHAGDIVHIPAGVPHQAKIAPGTTVTYLVFKEKSK
jgi:mannose-6-phosphate isomerase-like protein (cupin superfamily)